MNKSLHVRIEGPPVAQGRPRFTTKGGFARAYDPPRSRQYKELIASRVRAAAKDYWREPYFPQGPMSCVIRAFYPCPKADHRVREPAPLRWHCKGGADIDNVAKAVLDAANGIVYTDDGQVSSLSVYKYVAAQDGWVGLEVDFYGADT